MSDPFTHPLWGIMDVQEKGRNEAVNRYIKGDKPSTICRDASMSKKWLFTWVDRFKYPYLGWAINIILPVTGFSFNNGITLPALFRTNVLVTLKFDLDTKLITSGTSYSTT